MTKTATYDSGTQTFTLRGTGWHDTYPIADPPKWLAFYRKMHEDFPKSNGVYLEWVKALEGLTEERAGAASPPRGATTGAD